MLAIPLYPIVQTKKPEGSISIMKTFLSWQTMAEVSRGQEARVISKDEWPSLLYQS